MGKVKLFRMISVITNQSFDLATKSVINTCRRGVCFSARQAHHKWRGPSAPDILGTPY